MRITLIFNDLFSDKAKECLIEWIQERISDKSTDNITPLRYVDSIEVEENERKVKDDGK